MIASLKLGLICVSSCSMARTTGHEYKKNLEWNPGIPGMEKGRDFNPGIQNRSGLTPLLNTLSTASQDIGLSVNCKIPCVNCSSKHSVYKVKS